MTRAKNLRVDLPEILSPWASIACREKGPTSFYDEQVRARPGLSFHEQPMLLPQLKQR